MYLKKNKTVYIFCCCWKYRENVNFEEKNLIEREREFITAIGYYNCIRTDCNVKSNLGFSRIVWQYETDLALKTDFLNLNCLFSLHLNHVLGQVQKQVANNGTTHNNIPWTAQLIDWIGIGADSVKITWIFTKAVLSFISFLFWQSLLSALLEKN